MNNLHDLFFSPLSREYCAYWKYLMYFSFVVFVMTVLHTLSKMLNSKRKMASLELHFS